MEATDGVGMKKEQYEIQQEHPPVLVDDGYVSCWWFRRKHIMMRVSTATKAPIMFSREGPYAAEGRSASASPVVTKCEVYWTTHPSARLPTTSDNP